MPLDPTMPAPSTAQRGSAMPRLLGGMSVFTLLMTIPQVLTIWLGHEAAGVSVASWGAYLPTSVSAFLHSLEGMRTSPSPWAFRIYESTPS